MKYLDYKIEVLNYVIPYFRGNTDVKNILLAIGEKFNEFQDVIVYLLNTLTIKNAQGIWLDDIGKEVGTTRDEVDFGNYFCVNMPHVNVEKMFYFLSSNLDPTQKLSLKDSEFIQKIMAVIGGNLSSGTRNENLNIIKMITNAENVIIVKNSKCNLDVFLTGSDIIYTKNTLSYIESILADGTYLNEVHINE